MVQLAATKTPPAAPAETITNAAEPAETEESRAPSASHAANRAFFRDKLAATQSEYPLFAEENTLNGRFEIDVSKELPTFSKLEAKAYRVHDHETPDRQCIGYVMELYQPHHYEAIQHLKQYGAIPQLITLLDAGVIYISAWQTNRFVIIYEQPDGVSLQDLMDKGEFLQVHEIHKRIINPVVFILHKLGEIHLSHGALHPANIFLEDGKITVGDFIVECGNNRAPDIYQPIENLTAMGEYNAAPTLASDVYALGVLCLDICNQLGRKRLSEKPQLLSAILQHGSYGLLVNERSIPEHLRDFFRGAMLEYADERWKMEHLIAYANGKRFNLLPPGPPRDCPRSFEFAGNDHYALASLARDYYLHWEQALTSLRNRKFLKWLDAGKIHKEIREKIEQIHSRAARNSVQGGQEDELVARAIVTLDPQGAIRFKQLAVQPAAIPRMLCQYVEQGDLHGQVQLREMVKTEIIGYWRDIRPENRHQFSWDPETLLVLMRYSSPGFGAERNMYHLNPQLPCMSRDYLPYYAMSAKSLLQIMDRLAKERGHDKSLLDRHVISYLAARSGIFKEVKFPHLKPYPALYDNKELIAISIIATAQEKHKSLSLRGLSCWAALRLNELLDEIHSRDIRERISSDMQKVVSQGRVGLLLQAFLNKEYISRDQQGYLQAARFYEKNAKRIARLKDREAVWKRARQNGLKTAFLVSVFILFGVSYYLLNKYAMYSTSH